MLRSVGKQSGESVELVVKMKKKGCGDVEGKMLARTCLRLRAQFRSKLGAIDAVALRPFKK